MASWAIVIALTGVWALRVEAYPLSSMQMFSGYREAGPFEYFRVYAHFADGTSRRTYLDEAVGALHNTRFRALMPQAFDWETKERIGRFFGAIGQAYNRRHGSPQAVRYEVQMRRWDFKANRYDPDHGELVGRAFSDVSPPPPLGSVGPASPR